MADYVRKTMLSQSYVHIEQVHLTDEQKSVYESNLSLYQKPRAAIMLGGDIIPEVKTKDGSLIVYTTVFGSLADAIGKTDDFQRSLQQLYGSSKMLADACILECLFFSSSSKKKLIRSESRTGVVKATKNIFDLVARLTETKQTESHKRISFFLGSLEKKVLFLDQQFQYGRDRQLVWGNLHPKLLRLKANIHRLPLTHNEERVDEYKKWISELASTVKKFSEDIVDREARDIDDDFGTDEKE